jgi:FKBP-type peptidyl-prolyl cis-trans isomerase FklB
MFVIVLVLASVVAISVFAAEETTKKTTPPPPPPPGPGSVPKTTVPKPGTAPKFTVQKADALRTEMDKVSYAIGTQLGQNFKNQGVDIKIGPLLRGLSDAMAGKPPALTQEEIKKVMADFSKQMMAKRQEQQKAEAAKNLAAGRAFLEANKSKEGVKVLPSGLQYKILKEGTGKSPTAENTVKTHYSGRLIDGTEFDSSYKRGKPAEFPVKGVIKGWTEALQLMKEGGKWQLFIPPDLAYGEKGNPRGSGGIPGNSTLIFEVELIEILK